MKYLCNDLHENRAALLLTPLSVLVGGLLGLGILPLHVSLVPGSDFPFATVFSFLGLLLSVLYCVYNYRSHLMLLLSMGQTRRSYLLYFVCRQTVLFLISYGLFVLSDQLQYRLFRYLLGPDLGSFHPLPLMRLPIFLWSLVSYLVGTLFLSVMYTRFGNRLIYVLYAFFILFVLTSDFLMPPVMAFLRVHPVFLKVAGILLPGLLSLLSVYTAGRQSFQ